MADESAGVQVVASYPITKADDALQILYGWASVAVDKAGTDVVDAHGDIIAIEDLELAVYDFVARSRDSGEDHAGGISGDVVESWVVTPEKLDAMGIEKGALPLGWWIGVHISDKAAYERAKTQKAMFSIEGTAIREPING